MAKKIRVNGCPFCGAAAHWRKGDKTVRVPDMVMCPNCEVEVTGTTTPMSAVEKWNKRVMEHTVLHSEWNIDGKKC